jgi:hypothetical protein
MKSPHRISLHVLAALLLLLVVPAGLAAKGGSGKNGPDASLSLVLPDATGAAATSTQPRWGQQVTFNVVTDASWPSVEVACAQGNVWVYAQIVAYPFGNQTFTLQSRSWTGGAADCTAWLSTTSNNGSRTILASTSFHVDA